MRRLPALMAAGALAALACAGGAAAPGSTQAQSSPIRHVVVIYLENHSFDNVLGYWCNTHHGRCPAGGMPSSVKLSDGSVVTPSVAADKVVNVDHSVASQVAAIDGGKMDGWQNIPGGTCDAATGYQCISGYQPGQIPNITTLAQNFAVSDRTFSFADSPSWAGHMAMVAASTDHFHGDNPVPAKGVPPEGRLGCDSNRVTLWTGPAGQTQMVASCIPDPTLRLPHGGAFEKTPVSYIPTIMDRLNSTATLSWKIRPEPSRARPATGCGTSAPRSPNASTRARIRTWSPTRSSRPTLPPANCPASPW